MTNDVQIAVRLPSSTVDDLDALAGEMTKDAGVQITRTAVIRMLVQNGVTAKLYDRSRKRRR